MLADANASQDFHQSTQGNVQPQVSNLKFLRFVPIRTGIASTRLRFGAELLDWSIGPCLKTSQPAKES